MDSASLALGTYAESVFISKCILHGLTPSVPYTHDSKYDVIVEGSRLWKVQVKATAKPTQVFKNGTLIYRFMLSSGRAAKKTYSQDMVDYYAFYAADIDTFWIIPQSHTSQTTMTIRINPTKYEPYKNNFSQLA